MSREQMLKKRREGSKSSRRGDALFGLKDKLLGGGPYDLVGSLQPYAVVPSNGGSWRDQQFLRPFAREEECVDVPLFKVSSFWGTVTHIVKNDHLKGCKCPPGFSGDGFKNCTDVNECEEKTVCQCRGCKCKNTWGSYDHLKGCKCPPGFSGDGFKNCTDVNECEEKTVCQCRGCKCKNTWGSYECSCNGSLLYIREHDICISKDARGDVSWGVIWIIIMGLGAAALGAYTVYKYRIRTYMDSEIRAIMAQYMPLDNHPNTQPSQLECHSNMVARRNVCILQNHY
ncbi:hypothetical protein HID58_039893 [Brassica napus]|uniref:EGF-like calcium-binding domain-containing protein n=1 Tax=Brassica napus TaxID=3708 RepID=A0ABQ8BTD7_BRANA|nr:hypothetical protein HID58_039893 [Brassica napus]